MFWETKGFLMEENGECENGGVNNDYKASAWATQRVGFVIKWFGKG